MICYKFTTAKYAFLTLFDKRMKASRPNEFNDIFEFCPVSEPHSLVRKAMADPDACRRLYETERINGYTKSFEYFKAHDLEPRLIANLPRRKLESKDLDARIEASKFIGVICLSCRSKEYLLWSHYADCHRGCALGINVRHECFGRARINEKVHYNKCRPKRKWDRAGIAKSEELKKVCITKSKIWQYEREHRIAIPLNELEKRNGQYFVKLHPEAVQHIIYGEQMDREYMRRIEFLLNRSDFSHVRRFQIQRDPRSYSIRLVQYQPDVARVRTQAGQMGNRVVVRRGG